VIKPFGTGHFVQGLSVVGNTFKTVNGSVDRIEMVDTSISGLDYGLSRNILFEGNTFNGVTQATINPVTLEFERTSLDSSWTLNPSGYLPFQGWARNVTSIVAEGPITKSGGSVVFDQPYATVNYGSGNDLVQLIWPVPVKGKVVVTTRMDNPF